MNNNYIAKVWQRFDFYIACIERQRFLKRHDKDAKLAAFVIFRQRATLAYLLAELEEF